MNKGFVGEKLAWLKFCGFLKIHCFKQFLFLIEDMKGEGCCFLKVSRFSTLAPYSFIHAFLLFSFIFPQINTFLGIENGQIHFIKIVVSLSRYLPVCRWLSEAGREWGCCVVFWLNTDRHRHTDLCNECNGRYQQVYGFHSSFSLHSRA